ncbi:nuclear transport factor 2 family protein [Henriciella litoralis]|uniref:nuclear transport factor 2 family protein n=1 Tax=Henriciella litoralis TaxID=568102 RepID=UPI0009FC20D3|nr:nuclear transport factor 2 family protein [Henriciella litoralis]
MTAGLDIKSRTHKIRSVIGTYCKAIREADLEAICALFADGAILEDPAGSPQIKGKADIRAFYEQSLKGRPKVRINADPIVIGSFSATPMQIDLEYNGKPLSIELLSVMSYDDQNRILSMSAYFDPRALDG